MALKIWDGYDHYNSDVDMGGRSGFLQYGSIRGFQGFVVGPLADNPGLALQLEESFVSPQTITMTFGDRNAEAYIGIRMLFSNGGGCDYVFNDSFNNLPQVTVSFNPSNFAIEIYRGSRATGTLLGVSSNNVWSNIFNFIEIGLLIDGSVGFVTVKVNNVQKFTVTGKNTQATGNPWFDQERLDVRSVGSPIINVILTIDDFYYADATSGPGPNPFNTFIGDARTVTGFAVGNSAVQFTPLTGTNWGEISEIHMDSDVSYNYDNVVNNEDLFNFEALPSQITLILGVQLTGAYRKDDAGPRAVKQAFKSGSTEVYGATNYLGDVNYAYFTDGLVLDPATSTTWLASAVNALAGGYNVAV